MKEIFLPLGLVEVEWVSCELCISVPSTPRYLQIVTFLSADQRILERDPVAKALHSMIYWAVFEDSTADLAAEWKKVKEIIILKREDGDTLVIGN